MATQQQPNRHITNLNEHRTRRAIAKLQASPDVTEAWHRMADPDYVASEDDDPLGCPRGMGAGLTIMFGFGLGVLAALWWLLP